MASMKKTPVSLLALVATTFLTVLLSLPLEQALIASGWASPAWLSTMNEWVLSMYAHPLTLIWAGGVIGLTVGFFLDDVAKRFDGRYPMTRAGRLAKLAPLLSEAAHEMDVMRHRRELGRFPAISGDVAMLMHRLEKDGILVPVAAFNKDTERYLAHMAGIFHLIHPMLAAGMVDEAKAAVAKSATWNI
jgi:hypothetical protein